MTKALSEKKIEKIVKEYQDYLDSPFSDGYTVAYLQNKFGMSIKEMKEIYNAKRNKNKLQDKDLLNKLGEIVGKSTAYLDQDKVIRQVRELLKDNGYIKG